MRYRALRIVATIYRIIGWIIIVIGALGTCVSSVAAVAGASYMGRQFGYRAGAGLGVIQAVIILIIGLLYTGIIGVTLLAFAEGIQVFLDIEENTREIARRIRELAGGAAPSAGAPE